MACRSASSSPKKSQRILEQRVSGLEVGDAKKFDSGGPFLPAHVEALHRTGAGVLYSVAHYVEIGGDHCPDPDVVFLRRAGGAFGPISFQNTLVCNQPVRWLEDGSIEIDPREQASIADFANLLLKNIAFQQDLAGAK